VETPLTILYTANLRGDLELLPRLYTFLRQLKAHYTSEEVVQICADDPAQARGSVLLLDLGENCTPEVWHCEVTDGRSMLVVLDGMGYDAARVSDAHEKQAKLGDNVHLALVDTETPLEIEDVLIEVDDCRGDLAGRPYNLQIILSPADATQVNGDRLYLQRVEGGQVGATVLTRLIGRWSLVTYEIHDLPRRILPDPTIAASVEFVLGEARYAQKRKSGQ
jgi:hypothetical protein